ncbi:uncharacterized protein LOC131224926 [Magnolia sinica]|uniref:uncharacterized protein LOC131224926 n=1 Tax=Magnolia sinica TaxID=86752 RepID=UPI002657B422|nr:uncharacterized protein LOC131224926 [Magnolia sinica]
MAFEDCEKTSFITPWGTFCYRIMSFGLKNAGATFQRAMTALLEKFKLRLNPQKCVFGATGGKLLSFIVSEDGIRVDETKTKAIIEMPPPNTKKEIRDFLGRIQIVKWQLLLSKFDVTYVTQKSKRSHNLLVKKLQVFGDSQLIINQMNGDWRTKDEKLIPYHVYLENMTEEFEENTFFYMPQAKNQFADTLATLASMLKIPKGVAEWELTVKLQEELAFCL